jgi:hypothetical protein
LTVPGYYDRLAEEFVKPEHRRIVISHPSPEPLVKSLLEYEPPSVDKWIDRKQT